MKAGRLISVQVAAFLLALVVSSFIVHSALYLAPGDPITVLSAGRGLTPEAEQELREEYDLDEPFLARYVSWITDFVQGDMGTSIIQNADVSSLIGPRLSSTLLLLAMASILMVVVGVGLGLVAGLGGPKQDAERAGGLEPRDRNTELRRGDRADHRLRGQPGLVSDLRLRRRILRSDLPPGPAVDRPGDGAVPRTSAGSLRSRSSTAADSEYVETARARGIPAFGDRPSPRPPERDDPDRDRRRHHLRRH